MILSVTQAVGLLMIAFQLMFGPVGVFCHIQVVQPCLRAKFKRACVFFKERTQGSTRIGTGSSKQMHVV